MTNFNQQNKNRENCQNLYYSMALSMASKIGPVLGKTLVSYCGSVEAVFKEKKQNLEKIPGIGTKVAEQIFYFKEYDAVAAEIEYIEANDITALSYLDKGYPIRLKVLPDSPLVIFVKGKADLNANRYVALVGTRRNTNYGSEMTQKIISGLKEMNVQVVSGLAFGIDAVAHKACLQCGIPTLGVVAHGLDKIYPMQHRQIAKEIVFSNGGIVTEFRSGTKMHPDLFPRRNRIIAGLCDALVVVESMKKGGSMITAEIAHSYNKDVLAVPGKTTDIMSEGCNLLIKQLKAAVCESAEDIAHAMNWNLPSSHTCQAQLPLELSNEELSIIDILFKKPATADQIFLESKLNINKVNHLMFDMEMKGLIRQLPGKKYERVV